MTPITPSPIPEGWMLVPKAWQPIMDEIERRADKMSGDSRFTVEIDADDIESINATPSPISDQAAGEQRVLPKDVLDALRFYAHGDHYSIDDDHQSFDTVSGEPVNWMFSEKDDDCTMFEDGGIARAVLAGRSAGFEEPVEPFEGEVFTALSSAPTTGSPVITMLPGESLAEYQHRMLNLHIHISPVSPAASVLTDEQINVIYAYARDQSLTGFRLAVRTLLAASMGRDRT